MEKLIFNDVTTYEKFFAWMQYLHSIVDKNLETQGDVTRHLRIVQSQFIRTAELAMSQNNKDVCLQYLIYWQIIDAMLTPMR